MTPRMKYIHLDVDDQLFEERYLMELQQLALQDALHPTNLIDGPPEGDPLRGLPPVEVTSE